MIAFLSTLPPSGLRELHLSLVVPPESTTPEEGLESADAVADYLRDGRRCRALEKLTLNGNTFGWTGVRVIVGAIVSLPSASGARRGGNRTVSHVELFATGADAPDPDEGDTSFGEGAGTGTGARTRSTRRRSMTEYFIARRREHRAERKMRRAAAVVGGGGGRLSQPSSDDEEREDIRSGNAKFITRDNWRKLLGETVWANAQRSVRTRSSARALLGPARVLGCCVRQGDGDNGGGGGAAAAKGAGAGPHFPFMRLPPELRVQILRHLDDKRSLNDLQFLTVLSWACERSTIGYGSESRIPFSLRSFDSASTTSNSAANAIATLFAPTWSWPSAVRTHSIPRDWPAEVLDSGASSSVAGPARPEYGPWYTGEDGAWTVISPALWAFWECTGTRMGWER